MRRIEAFCQNLRQDVDIEEQISEAQRKGIIVSYKLITLTVMNARREADLCLWCDNIWSDGHLHSCLDAPDHNCMFTCGKDFEVFVFVKVSKEGLKPMFVKGSQDEVQFHCEQNVFDEMSAPKSPISPKVALVSSAHRLLDKMSEPVSSSNLSHHVSFADKNAITCENVEMKSDDIDEDSGSKIFGQQIECGSLADAQSKSCFKHVTHVAAKSNTWTTLLEPHDSQLHMALVDCGFAQGYDTRIIKAGVDNLVDNCSLVQNLQHVIESTHKTFDRMRVPNFMFEMAQIGQYESPPVSIVLSVDLPSNLLNVIEAPHTFHCCPGPPINYLPHYHLHQNDDELGIGDLSSKATDPQVQSKVFNVLNALHSLSFVDLVHCPLQFNNLEVVMCSSFSIGMNGCKPKEYELENDWMSFFYFKEIQSWSNLSYCCEFAMTMLSLGSLYPDYYVDSEMILLLSKCWKLFAFHLSISLGETTLNGNHAPNTPWVFMSFDHSRVESDTSSMFLTYTLEDKGGFEAVGNGRVRQVVLWTLNPSRIIGSNICEGECHTTRYDVLMSITISLLIFDPGGFCYRVDTLVIYGCGFINAFDAIKMEVSMLIFDVPKLIHNRGLSSSWLFDPSGDDIPFLFLTGEPRCTRRVLYKATSVRMWLKWELSLSMEYGLYSHIDSIFIFDPGGSIMIWLIDIIVTILLLLRFLFCFLSTSNVVCL